VLRFAALAMVLLMTSAAALGPRQDTKHLRVSGTRFVTPDGQPFEWRGITAFRLLEFVAHGRAAEADAYLGWAASQKLTVARVLAMAHFLFELSPADGVAALARLLDIAQRHNVAIEIVALADTGSYTLDVRAHVHRIGEIAARYPNAVIEIANEPYHPTQSEDVHQHAFLRELRALIPSSVPVSFGTVDPRGELAGGDYITWHSPRDERWPERMREGAALLQRYGKPVIADEPMGAADAAIPGKRDNRPERFRAAADAARASGLGATFHYEGGLQARRPTPTEAACLRAWLDGLMSASGGPP
jgi:hypothetical protein